MRIRTFLLLLGVPLLLMGALIVGLRVGEDELEQSLAPTPSEREGGSRGAGTGDGEAAARGVRLQRVGTFRDPLYVTAPPGDRRRVFIVEQSGRIVLLLGGKRVRRPFLNLSGEVTAGGEQGLLSMAFAPDYRRSGRFYVYFTDRNGDQRVQEFRRSSGSPNRADKSTRRQLLLMADPYPNHNGGLLLFGPDGLLYIGTGDGGSAGDPENRAQNLDSLLGKILRIDPRAAGSSPYRSPNSNPFVGRGGRNEIYAYGLRNPWRFSFDRRNGNLYIGDVGQNAVEEIDFARRGGARGRNYGWSCFEGRRRFEESRNCPGASPPVHTYGRSGGECSVTGGVVVRDPALPALAGRYVYGDYCAGRIRSLRVRRGRATGDRAHNLRVAELSSFGEDARGRVYATSLNGPVYRLRSR
ncbi:MAG: PQQ-dependent sugar dehydrogenase [Solirubrobacterales bacterium]